MAEKELIVKFGADVAGMQKQIQKASSTIQKEMKSASNGVGKSFDDMIDDADKVAGSIEKDFKSINFNFDKPTKDAIKKLDKVKEKSEDSADDTKNAFGKVGDKIKGAFQKGRNGASKELDKIGDKAEEEAEESEDAFTKMGDKIKGALKGIAVGVAIKKIGEIGLKAIETTAEFEALESQFSQTFGDLEEDASSALTKIAESTGVAEGRMKGSFTKISAFAKTTGMSTEDSLALGERAMVAIADSAAYYDRSLEDTTESLQSFLKGNYENDSALGLSCTETTRNAKANDLYGKSFKELSEEQKQLTLLAMVEEANELSGAMGQASRESDTWTNQLGNLKQSFAEMLNVIGKPILGTAVTVVKSMSNAILWLADTLKNIDTSKLKEIGIVVGAVAGAVGAYLIIMNKAKIATFLMTNATKVWGAITAVATSPITAIVVGVGLLVTALIIAYKKCDGFRNAVNKLKDKLLGAWDAIKAGASTLKNKISEAWDSLVAKCKPFIDIIKIYLVDAFNSLKDAGNGIAKAFGFLKKKFTPVVTTIKDLLKPAIDNAKKSFDKIQPALEKFATKTLKKVAYFIANAKNAFEKFKDIAGKVWTAMKPVVSMIAKNLVKGLKGLKEPISSVVKSFKSIANTLFKKLIPALWDKLQPILKAIKPIIKAVAVVLGGILVTAIGVAMGVINGIVKAIKGAMKAFSGMVKIVSNIFKLIVGIFTGDGKAIKDACKGIWNGIVDTFKGLWDAIKGFVKGVIDGVIKFFTNLWDTLVGHSIVPDTIDGIVECFKSIWGKIKGFVQAVFNGVKTVFTKLKNTLTTIWNAVKSVVSTVWGWIKKYIVPIAKWIWEKVKTYFTNLKNNLTTIWNLVKSAINKVWGWVKQYIVPIAKWIWEKVKTYFTNLKNNLTTIWNVIKSAVNKVWGWIKQYIVPVAKWIWEKVKIYFTNLKNNLTTIWNVVKSVVLKVWNWIKENIVQRVIKIVHEVKTRFDKMKYTLGKIWQLILEKVKQVWNWIKENIWSRVVSIYNNVKNKFTSLKDKVVSIFTTVKNKVSSVWGWIKENIWGKVVWIYNKVKDKFTSLKDKVVGVVSGIWKGVKSGMKKLCNEGFIKPLNSIIKKFLSGINTIITGVNWVINKLGGKKDFFGKINVDKWKIPLLAKGTNNWQGGNAIVGEKGREIVSDKKLGTFVADQPMLLPLSKGAKVLRNSKTEKMLQSMGVPAFGGGKNEGWFGKLKNKIADVWKKAKTVAGDILGGIPSLANVPNWVTSMFSNAKTKVKDFLSSFIGKKQDENGAKALDSASLKFLKYYITSPFGERFHPVLKKKKFHKGIDLAGGQFAGGKPVYSQSDGKVTASGYTDSTGYWNVINDAGTIFRYMHMRKGSLTKSVGDKVKKGMKLGTVGSTGRSTGAHLHFDVNKGGKYVNPVSYFKGYGYKPFANGGLIGKPTMALMGEAGKEAVVPLSNSNALKPFGNAVANSILSNANQTAQSDINTTYEFTIPVIVDGREIAKATATFTKEELDKLEKRSNRRNGSK